MFDVSTNWEERLHHAFKDHKKLSDDAIVALFNVNTMLRKYYMHIHHIFPMVDNEWTLMFHDKEESWKLNSNDIEAIDTIKKGKNLIYKVPDDLWKLGNEDAEALEKLKKAGNDCHQSSCSLKK